MPVAIAFAEPKTFVIHSTGAVSYPELQRAIDDLLAHPAFSRADRILIDARGVTGAPSTSELRALARDLKPLVDRGLSTMAIVTEQGFVYGVARMFAVFAEVFGLRVRACLSMEEAERWLNGEDQEVS